MFLWFHNAIGNLIQCPYVSDYIPYMNWADDDGHASNYPLFQSVNGNFDDRIGIQSNGTDASLP